MNPNQRRAMFAKNRVRRVKEHSFQKEFDRMQSLGMMRASGKPIGEKSPLGKKWEPYTGGYSSASTVKHNAQYAKVANEHFGADLSEEEITKLSKMRKRAKYSLGLLGGTFPYRSSYLYNKRVDLLTSDPRNPNNVRRVK